MSFYTVLHFVRPTAPPLVTGRDLAGFVREVAALRLTEPGNGFDFSVRFGRRIDLDRKPIVQTRRLSACVSTHRFIDWDMEEHHADLAGVCDALAGQSRTIYRAHVGFGFLRDEIYAALSRAGSPENTGKLGTGADFAVVDRRMVCRVRGIRFRHRFGYCTLIACSGSFLAVKTDGEVVLFRDGGEGSEILARARPLAGTVRALPALAGGRLSLRDDRTLVALHVGPAPAARP